MVIEARQTWRAWGGMAAHSAIAGLAIAGVISIQSERLRQPSILLEPPQQAEQQEHVRLNLLSKMPSFGFDNMVADWTFLNFVQYYGDVPARKATGFSLAPQYFDILTRRDPRFVDSYLFVSGTISHQLGNPKLALKLMKRGTDALTPQVHPKAFSVWRFAGLDQILLLGDLPGAARSFEMAANWAAQSEEYKPFASNFQATADFLRTNPAIAPVRFEAWSVVYEDARSLGDQQSVERARHELLKMGGIERKNEQGETAFIMPEALRKQSK